MFSNELNAGSNLGTKNSRKVEILNGMDNLKGINICLDCVTQDTQPTKEDFYYFQAKHNKGENAIKDTYFRNNHSMHYINDSGELNSLIIGSVALTYDKITDIDAHFYELIDHIEKIAKDTNPKNRIRYFNLTVAVNVPANKIPDLKVLSADDSIWIFEGRLCSPEIGGK